jgi:indolepyruvate ferredoxin oxidoreductase
VADGGAILDVHPDLARPVIPQFEINGRPFRKVSDMRLIPPFTSDMERQIHYERMVAARAYARANRLDRITVRGPADRLGLVSAGKSYTDMMQALAMVGLGEEELRKAGVRVYKLGLISPIEPEGLIEFAEGLEEVLVVEEKRGFSETLIRDVLYNRTVRPRVHGKFDGQGDALFPIHGEMQVDQVARALAGWLAPRLKRPELLERVKWLEEIAERKYEPVAPRTPYFCSGCPHNTSTKVLPGEVAGGGIGCHAMATYMNRGVVWLTHMGGEGAPWLGVAPFTEKEHIFQNVGDGTYFHSASKSLEACVASGVNITYKLLYNGAVAMTGGQRVIGQRTPVELARKLTAEGVKEVVIVAEQPERHQGPLGAHIRVTDKSEYDRVQAELKAVPGTTVIIFDQQCAAEKRRQRKRGTLETPPQRVLINAAVCEGCGDCGVVSNCLSVVPIETAYGRKTAIHQSSCNMDYSCLKGDCPSFMTVVLGEGAQPVRRKGLAAALDETLPEPAQKAACREPYKAMLIGIGGTGVVTVDALLATAAMIEGKYAVHLDQTGLAQKGGAVLSNLILADAPISHSNRISNGECDLLIAFDMLASVAQENLNRYHAKRTVAVANTTRISTAQEVTDVNAGHAPANLLVERLNRYSRRDRNVFLDSERIVEALFGDHLTNNLFLVGVSYQAGLLPLKAASIEDAIRANGVAVEQNLMAFRWGRRYVLDPQAVLKIIRPQAPADPRQAALDKLARFAPGQVAALEALAALIPAGGGLVPAGEELAALLYPRVADLILYQNAAFARRYLDDVRRVAAEEQRRAPGRTDLAAAVARWLFKLMMVKDEYEVARLWLQDPAFADAKAAYTGGRVKRYYHLHPPLLRRFGMKNKLRLGTWFTPALRLLYALKGVRGTPLDVFGATSHRRRERRLADWYRSQINAILPQVTGDNHETAVAIANLPDFIRGYEEVKERSIRQTEAKLAELLKTFNAKSARPVAPVPIAA